jgi:cell division protein FtsL
MTRIHQYLGYRGLRWHDYVVMGVVLPVLILLSAIAITVTCWRTRKLCS